jgi:hypothetical protein
MERREDVGRVWEIECVCGELRMSFENNVRTVISGHEFRNAVIALLDVLSTTVFCRKHDAIPLLEDEVHGTMFVDI